MKKIFRFVFSVIAMVSLIPYDLYGAVKNSKPNVIEKIEYQAISNGDRSVKKIALTFDDGPRAGNTERILKILEDKTVKATFFVVGSQALANQDIIKRVLVGGHEIGCHTWSHKCLSKLSKKAQQREIAQGINELEQATGIEITLFRPPYGAYNKNTLKVAANLDLTTITWDIDPRDWSRASTQSSIKREIAKTVSGSIILFHDGLDTHTPEILAEYIDNLKKKGYQFVSVSELLKDKETQLAKTETKK